MAAKECSKGYGSIRQFEAESVKGFENACGLIFLTIIDPMGKTLHDSLPLLIMSIK